MAREEKVLPRNEWVGSKVGIWYVWVCRLGGIGAVDARKDNTGCWVKADNPG